jgi:hypothetical protein
MIMIIAPSGNRKMKTEIRKLVYGTPEYDCEVELRALVLRTPLGLSESGYSQIHLSARESAMPFYAALGYEPYGKPFE